jgi:hypothetical protein
MRLTTTDLVAVVVIFSGAFATSAMAAQSIGLNVAPKDKRTLAEERRNPVARTCAAAADILASQTNGSVGNVSITHEPARGTVWRGMLLIHPEPPFAPPMECTSKAFVVMGTTFDPRFPPTEFPWRRPAR